MVPDQFQLHCWEIQIAPSFTQVGVDVFGPWTVCARRTRGGLLESKRWAVMFNSLVTRAVHIEVIESLSTSSFINALRRFIAIRGPAKLFAFVQTEARTLLEHVKNLR